MSEDSSRVAEAFAQLDPADLPDSVDEAALRRMRAVAKLLDEAVTIPGTDFRVGLDPIVGAVPVVGDIASAGISLYIVAESARLGVSYTTLIKMLANVSIDAAGGSIPYVGVLFDAGWKSNSRNLLMALDDLTKRTEAERDAVEIEIE